MSVTQDNPSQKKREILPKIETSNIKQDILQGLAEIYFYHCHKCGESNLSRDEIHQVEGAKFICLECERKKDGKETSVGLDK